jgi:curved DNA-binding protein CbpA
MDLKLTSSLYNSLGDGVMRKMKTFYDELQVERNATSAQIKRAFKEIAKVYHPDKNPPERQRWAHEQMSRLNFIVETLLNPTTRKEYDDLVKKYEQAILMTPRRPAREQNAIEREYAQVSVEIINLSAKYANCRLKIVIGASIGSIASALHLLAYLTRIFDGSPMAFAFTYFFSLIGGVMTVIGISDYLGRGQYRRRINELEQRRAFLRQRMYEAYVS